MKKGEQCMGPVSRAMLMLLPCWLVTAAIAQEIEPRPADQARLAPESLVLDVVQAGQRYIGVGERGHVLISSDGMAWSQAEFVPVQATLTRVSFAGGRLWAVGHDSTIIHSRDIGRTWALQHFDPEAEKPLLDVHFFNANEGIAIGAYGLYMRTDDAGATWEKLAMVDLVTSEDIDWEEAAQVAQALDAFSGDDLDEFDDVGDDGFGDGEEEWEEDYYDGSSDFDRGCYEFRECHLNAFIDLGDGHFLIAAERGYGYRSFDSGESWEAFRFPYPGSMFGLIQVSENELLAFGLRGHVQYSADRGASWEVMDVPLQSSLKGAVIDPQGRALMVGAGATRLRYDPQTRQFELSEDRLGSTYAAVLFSADGTMILAGEDGLTHE
jgi:photosystem II stability/assembly factor-like uncharacterized protein